MWYKEQPLNLIEKYYGTEVAFYFAWLGLYNFMLIPASAIGVFSFLMSVIYLVSSHDDRMYVKSVRILVSCINLLLTILERRFATVR